MGPVGHDGVDPEVQQAWIDHTLALRAQITSDKGSECKDTSVTEASLASPATPANSDAPVKLGRK